MTNAVKNHIFLLFVLSITYSCGKNEKRVIEVNKKGDTIAITSYVDGFKNGPLVRFNSDNIRSIIELYENDTMIKKTYYYENGQVSSEGPIVNNSPNGDWLNYYENGNLRSKIKMKEGNPGEFIQYYLNGNIEMRGEDADGNGIFEKFDSTGKSIWRLRFKDGEVVDTVELYNNNPM